MGAHLEPGDFRTNVEEVNVHHSGNALVRLANILGLEKRRPCEACGSDLWTHWERGVPLILDKWLRSHDPCPGSSFGAETDESKRELLARIAALFRRHERNGGTCRSCGRGIFWVMTKNDRRAPFDRDGLSHFATCPFASRHRRAK